MMKETLSRLATRARTTRLYRSAFAPALRSHTSLSLRLARVGGMGREREGWRPGGLCYDRHGVNKEPSAVPTVAQANRGGNGGRLGGGGGGGG